jgi:hypothetical protein
MDGSDSTKRAKSGQRPAHVRAPVYLTPSPPLPPEQGGEPGATSEHGGPKGAEPTRYGDWEKNGICWDF